MEDAISIEDAKMICELNWNFPSKHSAQFRENFIFDVYEC